MYRAKFEIISSLTERMACDGSECPFDNVILINSSGRGNYPIAFSLIMHFFYYQIRVSFGFLNIYVTYVHIHHHTFKFGNLTLDVHTSIFIFLC